jgi:hypothetical protein
VSKLRGVVALEVEVRELVVAVVVWHARRGFLAAAGEAGGGDPPAAPPASCRRSRRRAAGTHVLLTWVSQSKPRLLQHVRQRLCAQPFFAWLPQSWHVAAPDPDPDPEPAPPRPWSSMARAFLPWEPSAPAAACDGSGCQNWMAADDAAGGLPDAASASTRVRCAAAMSGNTGSSGAARCCCCWWWWWSEPAGATRSIPTSPAAPTAP